jgi:uncharacterized protein (DUF433 family)
VKNEFAEYPGVVVEPGRMSGKPTLGPSRVSAELVAECLDEGKSPEEIAYHYDLKLSDVLRFKQRRDD